MRKKKESTIDLLKQAFDREFGTEPASYVTFESGHIKLDLEGHLASDAGRATLVIEIECASRVPMAPFEKRSTRR